jgi:hypothetical protein
MKKILNHLNKEFKIRNKWKKYNNVNTKHITSKTSIKENLIWKKKLIQ